MKSSAAVASKPDPPTAESPAVDQRFGHSPEYRAALERWTTFRNKMRALNARREELHLALSLASASTPLPERVQPLFDRLDPTLVAQIRRNPRRIQLELEQVIDDILRNWEEHAGDHEEFQQAKGAEATRIACLFQGRHVTTIRNLATALEQLNLAIEAERAVRREYARVSPEPTSAALPDMSSEFREMLLSEWHSVGAVWARGAQQWLNK